MMTATAPLAEVTDSAIRLLCREIGAVNTARFINQFGVGYGNYTEERERLLEGMTVADIAAEIRRGRLRRSRKAGRRKNGG